jgi:selenocysteine lyase/cysteine desulfurase
MVAIDQRALTDAAWFARWRHDELARVDALDLTYLDYTGAALYPASLVQADARRLSEVVRGNPHSEHRASREATTDLDEARRAILEFLGADPARYDVVLTANATAACRLVGDGFRFGPAAPLILTLDNHNSVNGIRERAAARGARTVLVPLDADLRLTGAKSILDRHRGAGLFALPAQSNFSGVRHPLSLVTDAQRLGFRVLLDAASYLHSGTIDFNRVAPDFIALSIYKIAGYPTGIGALVARRDALAELERPWFAGGTVEWVMTSPARHRLRAGHEGFEDGTPPFLAAGAVPAALDAVRRADRSRLARHLAALTSRLLDGLIHLEHDNGTPVIAIHGPRDLEQRGATIALSVLDRRGNVIPYWDVEVAARTAQLAIRGGCFCNPGCGERALGLHGALMGPCVSGLGDSFTVPRLAACLGTSAVGALRLSLGLGSVDDDVTRAVEFFARYAR